MRKLFLGLFMMICFASVGQNVPDNEHILRVISTKESPFYYPNLFARYIEGDSTLTEKDYFHLYYGYLYNPNYKPLSTNTAADNLILTLDDNTLTEQARNELMLKYALQSFDYDPFSLTNINMLTYIYGLLGDEKNEAINADRLQKIIAAIQSSGTGLDEKSPWHVLYFSHSNDLMVFMGKNTAKRMVISRTTEYFPLLKKENGVRGYYFDFSRAYINKPDNLERKKSPGFEFNGTKLYKDGKN